MLFLVKNCKKIANHRARTCPYNKRGTPSRLETDRYYFLKPILIPILQN